jgi:hypothetical protein
VKTFNAAEFDNGLTLHASVTDASVGKYMVRTDAQANPSADNAAFAYTSGDGADTININISKANLAASGTANREDFSMSVSTGAGNDRIIMQIGDGVGIASDAWFINHLAMDANADSRIGIDAGAGNDYIHTNGATAFRIDAGAGNDAVYTDNSGAQVITATAAQNGSTESAVILFSNLAANATVTIGNLTLTNTGVAAVNDEDLADIMLEAVVNGVGTGAFAVGTATIAFSIAGVGPVSASVAFDLFTANWTTAAVNGDDNSVALTAATANANVADLVVAGGATITSYTQGVDPVAAGAELTVFNGGKATWVLNSGTVDIEDLVSGANDAYALYNQEVNVTFLGYTVSRVIQDFNTTNLEMNNMIKEMIAGDEHLRDLIVAEDGPGNTLVIRSLIDGARGDADFSVTLTSAGAANNIDALSVGALSAASIAAFNAANNLTGAFAAITVADVQAAVETGWDNWTGAGDYDGVRAQQNGINLSGANSDNQNNNTVTAGTGDDTIVLSTNSTSVETVVLVAEDQVDLIVNFASNDILDLDASLTSLITGTSIDVDGYLEIASNTDDGANTFALVDGLTVIDNTVGEAATLASFSTSDVAAYLADIGDDGGVDAVVFSNVDNVAFIIVSDGASSALFLADDQNGTVAIDEGDLTLIAIFANVSDPEVLFAAGSFSDFA